MRPDASYDTVDWGHPVSDHPLNRYGSVFSSDSGGLKAWWLGVPNRFGTRSNSWTELIRGRTGVLTGTTSNTFWRSGRPGSQTTALGFASGGGNASYDVPYHVDLSLNSRGTVAFWVKAPHTQSRSFTAFLDQGDGDSGAQHTWAVRPSLSSNNGEVVVLLYGQNDVSAANCYLNNIWCHITATWTGTTVVFYRNGTYHSDVSIFSFGWSAVNAPLHIGALKSNSGLIVSDSLMDDIRLYDRALTAQEVSQLYKLSLQNNIGLLNRFRHYTTEFQSPASSKFWIFGPS